MLSALRIRNVAIIESLTLALEPGFNVLTGETGAGKSIIVGALAFLLGERGSAEMVRSGADRATVEGVFDASDVPDALRVLDERGVEVDDGLVVLRRELVPGGKSRGWINGTPVPSSALAVIGQLLVNLHGQHEAQTLLSADAQRGVLDAFAGATAEALAVCDAHAVVAAARADIEALLRRRATAERRADYLRHVVKEIESAKLVSAEEERLEEEGRRLAHVEDLREHLGQMRDALEGGDDSALARLATARRVLAAAQRLDPSLGGAQEALDAAIVSLEEIARDIGSYETTLDADPQRLAEIERRRDVISRVTRKYGGSVDAAQSLLAESKAELDVLDTAELDLRALTTTRDAAEHVLHDAARVLSARRATGASRLEKEVGALLPALGMTGGRFTVALVPREAIGPAGAEDVEFRVALNPGHEARPLARVASGGELSRLMLALKAIVARLDGVPTLVFDEVDAGIGGAVAQQVGNALREVSAHHQVLVITHLAQIASRAHHQIVVSKGAHAGVTAADVAVVTGDDRVSELARMLDGDPRRAVSRAHARELLEAATARAAPPDRARTARRKRSA